MTRVKICPCEKGDKAGGGRGLEACVRARCLRVVCARARVCACVRVCSCACVCARVSRVVSLGSHHRSKAAFDNEVLLPPSPLESSHRGVHLVTRITPRFKIEACLASPKRAPSPSFTHYANRTLVAHMTRMMLMMSASC